MLDKKYSNNNTMILESNCLVNVIKSNLLITKIKY